MLLKYRLYDLRIMKMKGRLTKAEGVSVVCGGVGEGNSSYSLLSGLISSWVVGRKELQKIKQLRLARFPLLLYSYLPLLPLTHINSICPSPLANVLYVGGECMFLP